jgi:integral membrane sensor domain MASE1
VSLISERQQYRLALCGHKAVEAGAVCLMLMVQGDLTAITLAHLVIATKTGVLAVVPALGVTFTRYARHFLNRWTASAFLGGCTFLADALIHQSHYPGEYTEAALTGIGAFFFSLVVSYTPIGKKIDQLAETFLHRNR